MHDRLIGIATGRWAGFWPHWRIRRLLALWFRRAVTRRHLAGLDRNALLDVGVSPEMQAREVKKPFWRA